MPKSNLFDMFAAGSASSGSSWMTTKKRGRDDDQIFRDAQLAKEARKDKSSRRRRETTLAATAAPLKAKSRGGRSSNKSKPKSRSSRRKPKDDSDDENDSFIASDEEAFEESDEEEEADFLDESDEDEEDDDIVLPDSDGDDNDSEDGSDDDSIQESSPEKPKRTRLNQLRLKGARGVSSTRKSTKSTTNSRDDRKRNSSTVRTNKFSRKTKSIVTLDDSSDDYNGRSNRIAAKKSIKPSRNAEYVLSSDSDDLETGPFQSMPRKKKDTAGDQRTTSKFFAKKNDLSPALQMRSKKKSATKNSFLSDSDDDFEEKKPQKSAVATNSMSLGAAALAEINLTDTDDEDEDNALNEALALSTAIEESRKTFEKSKAKTIYKDDFEDEKQEEEEDENDAEEIDVYEDETEQEASNVLETANNLSAHILSTMTKWFQGENKTNSEVVPKGMILDGALSLSSLQNKKRTMKNDGEEKKDEENDGSIAGAIGENDAHWISQETMQKICPQIILKDYQLIGVNWMALLNRLTFDLDTNDRTNDIVKKNKKGGTGRNVNGVLADEMGLGKTVQTIAFLAWLKSRSFGNANGESDAIDLVDNCKENIDQPQCPARDNHKPHIIIVPASVLDNWMIEFEKFCPTMNVVK